MPELPEVETVRRGLAPAMEGASFVAVETRRPDLRIPFPQGFCQRLEGKRVEQLGRRGKYMTAGLSSDETLVMHLGMTGRFTVSAESGKARRGSPHRDDAAAHRHVSFVMEGPNGEWRIDYDDPRRFGFMDLVGTAGLENSRHFAGMGPEPMGAGFTPESLKTSLTSRSAPIKAALLDQSVVAGLGNIYVCEALFRARISPRREAQNITAVKAALLHAAIRDVLAEAIEAGGSTLRNFAASDGAVGYFQHRFRVYDREGEPCPACGGAVRRFVQSGRSTFYCGNCQR